MRNAKRLTAVLSLIILTCFTGGCATTTATTQAYKDSGFLPDYTRLKPLAGGDGAEVWREPDAELKKYDKVLLERILVWYKDNADFKGIDPVTLKGLVDYFHDAITKELGSAYPVVNEPGPDVMRLRVAITQLVPTQVATGVVMDVIPFGGVAELASGALTKGGGFGSAPYLGDAAIEAMGLDSMTSSLLFEYVDRRIGKEFDINLNQGASQAASQGVSGMTNSLTSWGYTKQAFDYWAKKFRESLDRIHGVAAK
ncbi:MAG TPA: DUF3313 domain-containing protein [Thermodesulfovibrionales bacterium]|nr:DUF3313 domain-containing protein [Thermodesulfovibrionales bacterium]